MKIPCGDGSANQLSDVLSQHLRNCSQAQLSAPGSGSLPQGQQRSKKACDRCAQAKRKCDSQEPCGRCGRGNLVCKYSREGYLDPYRGYSDGHDLQSCATNERDESFLWAGESGLLSVSSSSSAAMQPALETSVFQPPNHGLDVLFVKSLVQFGATQQSLSSQAMTTSPGSCPNPALATIMSFDALKNCVGSSICIPGYSTSLPLLSDSFGQHQPYSLTNGPGIPSECLDLHLPSQAGPGDWTICHMNTARKLDHISGERDQVACKIMEMSKALQTSPQGLIDAEVLQHMTRAKILASHELFRIHFQQSLPLLHAPTYSFVETPTILSLVMMLVGASYSSNIIPAQLGPNLAMHLQMLIDDSSVSQMLLQRRNC